MPIKGFDSIKEQTTEKVEKMYGKPIVKKGRWSNCQDKYVLKSIDYIPYICDETGKEYTITWRHLFKSLNEPHFIKFNHSLEIFNEQEKQFIIENYPIYGPKYCAKHLKKDRGTIIRFAFKNNIKLYKVIAKPGFIICYKCHQELSKENFTPKQQLRSELKPHLRGVCHKCNQLYEKEWQFKKSQIPETQKELVLKRILSGIKNKCMKKNIPYDLTLEWAKEQLLKQNDCCPVFNIKLNYFNKNKPEFDSPSVDRLIPKKDIYKIILEL